MTGTKRRRTFQDRLHSTDQAHMSVHDCCRKLLALSEDDLMTTLQTVLPERVDILQSLVDWAVPEHVYGTAKSVTEARYQGVIKSFSEKNGYGFITSPEIIEAFGMDLLVSDRQIRDFKHGDSVTFAILLNKGKPQAFDLASAAHGGTKGGCRGAAKSDGKASKGKDSVGKGSWQQEGWMAGGGGWQETEWAPKGKGKKKGGYGHVAEASPRVFAARPQQAERGFGEGGFGESRVAIEGVTDARYVGQVKSLKPGKFGFLVCEQLRDTFDQDIYVHYDQLRDFQIGDVVTFGILVNEKNSVKGIDLAAADVDDIVNDSFDEPLPKKQKVLS